MGGLVFGGSEAAERAEFLGGRGDRYTAGLLRNRGRGEKEKRGKGGARDVCREEQRGE